MTAPAHLSGGRSGSTDVVDRPSQGNLPMSVTDLPEAVQAQSRGRAATGSNQSSDPDRVIHTRRVSFEESLADLPKFFAANGNPVSSHFAASLSFHTGNVTVLAPYTIDNVSSPTPNEAWLVAEELVAGLPRHPQGKDITVRRNIYPVDGTDQD